MTFSVENQLKAINDSIHEASRFMQRDFSELVHLQGSKRGVSDFVHKCYVRLQSKLISALAIKRPNYKVMLANEPTSSNDSEYFYVIEPVSGIVNFRHGIPFCCMVVALFKKDADLQDQPIAISIHNPILRETFYAGKAFGAWSENYNETIIPKSRMRTSSNTDLDNAVISSSLFTFSTIQGRNFGSDFLEMAYLACGRIDAIIHQQESLLTQAGLMLIIEAGGYTESIGNHFLASSSVLQKQTSEIFHSLVSSN